MIGYLTLRAARGVGPLFGGIFLVLAAVGFVITYWYVVVPLISFGALCWFVKFREDRRLEAIDRRAAQEDAARVRQRVEANAEVLAEHRTAARQHNSVYSSR